MPTYVYNCNECDIEFETVQRMNDLAVADCPYCHNTSKHRVPQPMTIIDRTPHTLGSLADKRKTDMGKYEYDDVTQKMANERKQLTKYCGKIPEGASLVEKGEAKRPWYRPDSDAPDTKLLKASPEAINKFVMDGTRPIGTS